MSSGMSTSARRRASAGAAARIEFIGRAAESEAIARFLDAGEWPAVQVLDGPPGIGKTALWLRGVEQARTAGIRVLACRPVDVEASLAFGGLVDLWEEIRDDELGPLPAPQALALATALRRSPEPADLPDALAVSAGFRAALEALAAERPLLIAIDDVQWLDPSSAAVLAYVMRRPSRRRIGWFFARRSGTGPSVPLPPPGERIAVHRMTVPPLDREHIERILRVRSDGVLSVQLMRRMGAAARGNPMFAVEMAVALRANPAVVSREPLAPPGTLLDLVESRVMAMGAAERESLVAVASLAVPSAEVVATALGRSTARELHAARRAGILDDRDGLHFVHPLYAQCILQLADPEQRRDIHRRLAACVPEPDERARHLGLASTPPDEVVATVLEEGADAARARGALQAAAELFDQARRFTPETEGTDLTRRAFHAAELAILVGDRPTAAELLPAIVAHGPRPLAARAAGLHAEMLASAGDVAAAGQILRRTIEWAPEPRTLACLHLDLAYLQLMLLDVGGGAAHTAAAVVAAEASQDPAVTAEALAFDALARTLAGQARASGRLDEALRLEDPARAPYLGMPPSGVAGLTLGLSGDPERARTLLAAAATALDAIGDAVDLVHVLLWSAWLALREGRLVDASRAVGDATDAAEATGSTLLLRWARALEALIAATRGDDVSAGDAVAPGIVGLWEAAALALAALTAGDLPRAAALFGALAEPGDGVSHGDPELTFFVPDAAEALARTGHAAEADRILLGFEHSAAGHDRWHAPAARARAEILAAEGRLDEAITALRALVDPQGGPASPVERARALLALGRLERRTGLRRAARASLDAAEEAFRGAGADGWADAAAAERRRLPGRRAGAAELTAAERRIALLSGAGRTNRDVAALLSISPKTVEASLSRAYRKLGVTSRAELGAWAVTAGDDAGERATESQ